MLNNKADKCFSCGVLPWNKHFGGCGIETCALCGKQLIACGCVYEINGMSLTTLEEDHCDIYHNGASDEMWDKYDEEVEKYGGPLIWDGLRIGIKECRELGWYARFANNGWEPCDKNALAAREDLNRFFSKTIWDKHLRKFILK